MPFALGLVAALVLAGMPKLSVVRAPGAEDCAEADTLASLVEVRLGRPVLEAGAGTATAAIAVAFSHDAEGYHARIEASGRARGVRMIDDPSPTCRALTGAVALTLSLSLSPEEEEEESAPPPDRIATATITGAPTATAAPRPPPAEAPPEARPIATHAAAGFATGVVRSVAPLFAVGAARSFAPLRASLEGLFIPSGALPLGPGQVDVYLAGGSISICADLAGGRRLILSACGVVSLAAIHASATGFSANGAATRPWLAAGVSVAAGGEILGPLGWFLRAAPLISANVEAFSVENVGTAYAPERVNLLASVGLSVDVD